MVRGQHVMEIIVAENAGFCFGVKRALEQAARASEEGARPVHTLGALIHNPQEIARLRAKGITAVSDLSEVVRVIAANPRIATIRVENLMLRTATPPPVGPEGAQPPPTPGTTRRSGQVAACLGHAKSYPRHRPKSLPGRDCQRVGCGARANLGDLQRAGRPIAAGDRRARL